ncbi:hypothetical protein ACTQ33_02370 [Candidatus Avoscillospira sp. LCP25S3_F1]|uniref:hypothetical protein n=1 Tax=Candidatus Avoscillospira sp. LCP25S3_F1 TaxID=3438825 RepID=UPI003F938ECC
MISNIDVKQNLFKVLLKCFVSVLIVYLIFTPVFYISNLLYIKHGNSVDWVLIFAYLSRFLAVLCVGVYHRRKNRNILRGDRNWPFLILLCGCLGLSVILHLKNMPHKWYFTWASTFRIYDVFADNLFFVVFIEQLFNSYLITSFLLCSLVVFCRPLKKVTA